MVIKNNKRMLVMFMGQFSVSRMSRSYVLELLTPNPTIENLQILNFIIIIKKIQHK
jgi:hypothetical protein